MILKTATTAAHLKIIKYYKDYIATRPSLIAFICDPRLKLAALGFLYSQDGGDRSQPYNRAKQHFLQVYSEYQKRASGLATWERARAANMREEGDDIDNDKEIAINEDA